MKKTVRPLIVILAALLAAAHAYALEPDPGVSISQVKVSGRIEGPSFSFGLDIGAATSNADSKLPLVSGDVVLEAVARPAAGYRMHYDADARTYAMTLANAAAHEVSATFAARARALSGGEWRESSFDLPAARMRSIEVICDRTDLEVQLPGALRVQRNIADNKLTITALLTPGRPFVIRWKPQVQELEAELVFASEANTVATVSAGLLHVDTLFEVNISQGKLEELTFIVPAKLSVTQVRGAFIRDWGFRQQNDDGSRTLVVELNRPQTKLYGLQILGETELASFPAEADAPVIEPRGGIRAAGSLAIGTNSAIQLVVRQTGGLTQINAEAFPRVVLDRQHPRPLPSGKAFYFVHATSPYRMTVAMADIVPSYDASFFIAATVADDDLTMEGDIALEVRDAPVRHVVIDVPAGFKAVDVTGAAVEDATALPAAAGQAMRAVEVHFKQPVIGQTLLQFRLEMGSSPLGAVHTFPAPVVRGATVKRSNLVIAASQSVQIDKPQVQGQTIREVNIGALPRTVPDAQYAYSFRTSDWTAAFNAQRKPAGIRAELFHLTTIGQGVVYGNVAFNYYITGSPIDELQFLVPESIRLDAVRFIGRDIREVRPADPQSRILNVRLTRKVSGDYNLGLIYSLPFKEGDTVEVGGVQCAGDEVKTQTGYIAVASHQHLDIETLPDDKSELREIDTAEVPGNYRLLVTAPMLKAFKYLRTPHARKVKVTPYDRLELLPAIIEVTDIHTEVFAHKDKPTESRTTVRYKVKNSARQFLPLKVPEGVEVWRTFVGRTELDPRTNQLVPNLKEAKAAHDKDKGLLLVPLQRQANPNEPITVVVEYGKEHGELGLSGGIELNAPASDEQNPVQSTYSNWHIRAPDGWAVFVDADETNLSPQQRPQEHGNLATIMSRIADSWAWAWEQWKLAFGGYDDDDSGDALVGWTWLIWLLGLVAIITTAVRARQYVPDAVLVTALAFALLIGVTAAGAPAVSQHGLTPDDLKAITLSQTVTLNTTDPAYVEAKLVPQWRQYAGFWTGVAAPILAALCLGFAAYMPFNDSLRDRRGPRRGAIALGVAMLLVAGAAYPVFWGTIVNVLTWLAPTLLLIYAAWRVVLRPMFGLRPAVPAAAAAAIALMLLPGTAIAADDDAAVLRIAPKQPVLERIDARLTADDDSVEVDLTLKVRATEPVRYLLMPHTPILLTPDDPDAPVRIEREAGKYYLAISEAGEHEFAARFLSPLPDADGQQGRRMRFPLPSALTNRVELVIPKTGLDVSSATAMRLTRAEANNQTTVSAIFGPGDEIDIYFKPRARETSKEQTRFFSQVTSVARFDASHVEARHRVVFQIAQGELKEARIRIPRPMTVTSVQSPNLGAWRFDPANQVLEVRLAQPATGEYVIDLVTQIAQEALPYDASIGALAVQDAVRQSGALGLLTTPAVYITETQGGQKMNVDDFTRTAAPLLQTFPGYRGETVRFAYRMTGDAQPVTMTAAEVTPEIRVQESAAFDVKEERLTYNGALNVQINKAGVFSIDLRLPAAYEIDDLKAPAATHWDDAADGQVRTVTVHFAQKLLGQAPIRLVMSRAVAGLPQQIDVPRVEVADAAEHEGTVQLIAERGVRLTVAQQDGLIALNPIEHNIRTPGALLFKLLEPDWFLSLTTAVLEPRINVTFLHEARVGDGVVHHRHRLRYSIHHAGTKLFELAVPTDAVENTLVISGSRIARRQLVEPGRYLVELEEKWFDEPYVLTVSYDTRFRMPGKAAGAQGDDAAGTETITLRPVRAVNAELQRGHIVVMTTQQVQISGPSPLPVSLQEDDPRTIPGFKADELASAALCYLSSTGAYRIPLTARAHGDYDLLPADSLETNIETIVAAETLHSVTRVRMTLRVGTKQHLLATLPPGSQVWSLTVNDKSMTPAQPRGQSATDTVLIPLAAAARGSARVDVDLVYVSPAPPAGSARNPRFIGPMFDLPLNNVAWTLYMPDGFVYRDFEGTMALVEASLEREPLVYSAGKYETDVYQFNLQNRRLAQEAQQAGEQLARQGNQLLAQQAFDAAVHASAFNEDARVKRYQFNNDLALAGLVGSRQRLRALEAGEAAGGGDEWASLRTEDIERVKGRLSQADSENLLMQTTAWTEVQEKAAGEKVQLAVIMPRRGKALTFTRSVQVKPDSPMEVAFEADEVEESVGNPWPWAIGAFVVVGLYLLLLPAVTVCWRRTRDALARSHAPRADDDDRNDDEDEAEYDDDDIEPGGSSSVEADGDDDESESSPPRKRARRKKR